MVIFACSCSKIIIMMKSHYLPLRLVIIWPLRIGSIQGMPLNMTTKCWSQYGTKTVTDAHTHSGLWLWLVGGRSRGVLPEPCHVSLALHRLRPSSSSSSLCVSKQRIQSDPIQSSNYFYKLLDIVHRIDCRLKCIILLHLKYPRHFLSIV
jgi:hypothetical protein